MASHIEILNSGDIDAVYEYFWYNFKDSVVNISKLNEDIFTYTLSKIKDVSETLNIYKKTKDVSKIIFEIENFLTDFLWTTLNAYNDKDKAERLTYHINIAYTNVKRWQALNETSKTNAFKLLALIYSILTSDAVEKASLTLLIEKIIKGVFQRERIFILVVEHAYSLKSSAIFNKLLKEDSRLTVEILHKMNIIVPFGIKNGCKIIQYCL